MKINLIRNLNSQRNKEQEDSFEQTMNYALYFNINPVITKIDGWKLSNVKQLVKYLPEAQNDVSIEFTKWDEKTEYIIDAINVNLSHQIQGSDEITNSIRNRDYNEIHSYIKEIGDDKNLKLGLLLTIANELKDNPEVVYIIDTFVNNGVSTLDVAIDAILPLLMVEDNKYE